MKWTTASTNHTIAFQNPCPDTFLLTFSLDPAGIPNVFKVRCFVIICMYIIFSCYFSTHVASQILLLCPSACILQEKKMLKKTAQFNARGNVVIQWWHHLTSLPSHRGMLDTSSLATHNGMCGIPLSNVVSTVCAQIKVQSADAFRLLVGVTSVASN